MKYQYTISIDLDSTIIAESREEAIEQAKEQLNNGFYSMQIVDVEQANKDD